MKRYNFAHKMLHKICLSSKLSKRTIFDLEKFFFYKENPGIKNKQHLFITGLPRSGTTALLNYIYKTNSFASLTYSDMPFVLSPNLFSKFFINKKNVELKRLHDDGIKYNLKSPEAFDEVFWNMIDEDEYKDDFIKYITLILKKYNKEKYLSKNNSNYKRIKEINFIFPSAYFLVTFRDPLQQAYSLLNQHKKFCELQKKDKFILTYMNYLGHNEFGLNYKSWNLPKKFSDAININHWLEQWYLFYKNIYENINGYKNIILVSYDNLCKDIKLVNLLLSNVGLNIEEASNPFNLSYKNNIEKFDKEILSVCNEIYLKLLNSKKNLNSL